MNSNGEPCFICEAFATNAGTPGPKDYDISVVNGQIVATPKQAAAAPIVADPVPEVQAKTEEVQPIQQPVVPQQPVQEAPQQPAPAPTPTPEPVQERVNVETASEQPYEEEYKSTVPDMTDIDRSQFADAHYNPETGDFVLALAPVSNRRARVSKKLGEQGHIVRFVDFYEAVISEITRVYNANNPASPVASYYQLDTWKRREVLQQNSAKWSEMLGKSTVECTVPPEGDARILLAIIEAKAVQVIGNLY
jgi:hypothetical protein